MERSITLIANKDLCHKVQERKVRKSSCGQRSVPIKSCSPSTEQMKVLSSWGRTKQKEKLTEVQVQPIRIWNQTLDHLHPTAMDSTLATRTVYPGAFNLSEWVLDFFGHWVLTFTCPGWVSSPQPQDLQPPCNSLSYQSRDIISMLLTAFKFSLDITLQNGHIIQLDFRLNKYYLCSSYGRVQNADFSGQCSDLNVQLQVLQIYGDHTTLL